MKHAFSRIRSLAAQALLIVAAIAVLSTSAAAHAVLVASTPKNNAVVNVPPKKVILRFDARIEKSVTQVILTDGKGHKVKVPTPSGGYKAGPPDRLIIPMPPLKVGSYKLEYRVMASDGHLTPGLVRFTVRTGKGT